MKKLLFGGTGAWTVSGDFGLLLLRLFAGISLAFAHGRGKLPPGDQFIDGVEALGFPVPIVFAWAAALSEFGGGLLVAAGLLTRPAALAVASTMAVAAFMQHADDPFRIKEMALLYLSIAVLCLLRGAGRFSLDALIGGRASSRG